MVRHALPIVLGLAIAIVAAPAARAQASAAPVLLNHPAVTDTAHLKGGDTVVTLSGVQGWAGDPARALQAIILQAGDKVTCQPQAEQPSQAKQTSQAEQTYTCKLPTGADVGELALATGDAKPLPGAPADYQAQAAAAEAGHRGVWGSQVAGPAILQHPMVQTTSEIAANGRVYPLDGLDGFAAPYYTLQLQEFIDSHGGQLRCEAKSGSGRYVCRTPEGTDIATVALLEGLARVSADAPPDYRADQMQAVRNKSGFWFNPPQQVLTQLTSPAAPPLPPDCCVAPPSNLTPSITEDDGIPVAVIDSAPVFFIYIREIGWGYYDHLGAWHTAPERFHAQLERVHPVAFPAGRPPGLPPRAVTPEGFRATSHFGMPGVQSRPAFLAPPAFSAPGPIARPRPLAPLHLGLGPPRPGFAALHGVGVRPPLALIAPHPAFVPFAGRR